MPPDETQRAGSAAPQHRGRGRKRWVAAGAVLVLVALLALAPSWAAPFARRAAAAEIAAAFGGEASFERFSLAWPDRVRAQGLAVSGAEGEPSLSAASLELRVPLAAWLFGSPRFRLELERPRLFLRERPDGSWSHEEWQLDEEEADAGEDEREQPWEGRVLVRDGRVVLLAEERTASLEDVQLTLANDATLVRLTGTATLRGLRIGSVSEPVLRAPEGTLDLRLQAPLEELEQAALASLLAAGEGELRLELGGLESAPLQLAGTITAALGEGTGRLAAELAANGGSLTFAADLSTRVDAPRATLALEASGVGANAHLSPLFAYLHPAFAGLEPLQGSELGGRFDLALELDYAGALPFLTGGAPDGPGSARPPELELDRLQGEARFAMEELSLRGSPALRRLLRELGLPEEPATRIRPVVLSLADARIAYAEPWTWTLEGIETRFTGSVGLDRTLELAWSVPVTEALTDEIELLEAVRGTTLELPIRGTLSRPRIEWDEALEGLAARALRGELSERLGLGSADGTDGPEALLAEADRLWRAGEKAEAAALYRRLREEHQLSLVYALNQRRIKERGRYRE